MIIPYSTLLNTRWLISDEAVINMIPLFWAYAQGRDIDFSFLDNKAANKPYIIPICAGKPVNVSDVYDLQNNDVPASSIAVIPIQGVILPEKMFDLVNNIRLAENNPNVIAVVFLINSPGGSVFYLDTAASVIKSMTKPKAGYAMNVCASAAMWLASSTDKIFCSSPFDRLGSVGTMTKSMDFSKLLKDKLGIDMIEVYATLSTRKNEAHRNLINTDLPMEQRTALIIEDLDMVNAIFHQAIQTNLSISPGSEVFSGADFPAAVAIKLGLAASIDSFENVLLYSHKMGLKSAINQMLHAN